MNYPDRIIQYGNTSRFLVQSVQAKLNETGCGPLEENGIFGIKTRTAVKAFQATHQDQNGSPLEIDGKVGPITWAALFGPDSVEKLSEASNPLLQAALEATQSQIGVMEKPPGSNKGPEVNAYLASVGLPPGLYWCASFVYWCFNQAASQLKRANPLVKTGACVDHWNRSKARKIDSSKAVARPSLIVPGSIFIIDHGHGSGHTGIVNRLSGGFIHTIEGNSNPAGSANGIGVFALQRKIIKINKGFLLYK